MKKLASIYLVKELVNQSHFVFFGHNCGPTIIFTQISIIFMYLHENNIGCLVRFSILSNNFHKNNPKYYDAVDLSSFARGKNETITHQR